jgi:hypothetical protein
VLVAMVQQEKSRAKFWKSNITLHFSAQIAPYQENNQ